MLQNVKKVLTIVHTCPLADLESTAVPRVLLFVGEAGLLAGAGFCALGGESGFDLPLRRWSAASIRAYRTDSNQAENARMTFSRGWLGLRTT
ncbi:hypothetical protein ACVIWV_001961 [Bradyrhizobium diazoefficiens]